MSVEELASQKCFPCKGIPPMPEKEVRVALSHLPGWSLVEGRIQKDFRFSSYLKGLDFAHLIGELAEKQDHHPDMLVRWRRVKITWYTHSIKGLSKNDFVMAAKTELEFGRIVNE